MATNEQEKYVEVNEPLNFKIQLDQMGTEVIKFHINENLGDVDKIIFVCSLDST